MHMLGKKKTDVVVVGAGPVGLFSALLLAEAGLKVEIYDKDWRGSIHSYALTLHSGSLRLLNQVGLSSELIKRGRRIGRLAFYEKGERMAEIDLTKLDELFPYALVLPQCHLENLIEDKLKEKKIRVHWNHRVQDLDLQNKDRVIAKIERLEKVSLGYPIAHQEQLVNKTLEVEAKYILGADGCLSRMRRVAGIEFPDVLEKMILCAFEFQMEEPGKEEARITLAPGEANVFWPMADGRCRMGFQVPKEPADWPDVGTLNRFIQERTPWCREAPEEVYWSTIVHFDRRLAERFGEGRVWLAGDAAHVTSPAGSQSMNVGLREARDLTQTMADALADGDSETGFQKYNSKRVAEWRQLLGLDEGLVTAGGNDDWIGKIGPGFVPCIPASGPDLETYLAQLGLR